MCWSAGMAPCIPAVPMTSPGGCAKYTRGRGPVTLRYREETLDKSAALRREAAIKRLSRTGKQALIDVYNKENNDEI